MKKILTIILSIMLAISHVYCAQKITLPKYDKIRMISLYTYNGWLVEISKEGTVKLIYGSSPMDVATSKAQVLSCQEVLGLLAPHLLSTKTDVRSISVTILVKDEEQSPQTFYLTDRNAIAGVMSQAIDKCVPASPERFKELLKKYPPVQPDESSTNSVKR